MDTTVRKVPNKKMSEPVDEWLAKEGFFRKIAPKDSTCLFRVVSEQIYLTQHDHIRVRKECVEFMQKNPNIIEKNVSISVNDYLDQMACFTQWGGDNEIKAMSLLYKVDFVVFNAQTFTRTAVTNNGFDKSINLCHTPPKQYDGLYTQEYMSNAAFCQSLVYQTLYKNVFNITDIDGTVNRMLHERSPDIRHDKFFLKGNFEIRDQLRMQLFSKIDYSCDESDESRTSHLNSSLPFPYRVAKALDPYIYRNTDLDVWHELKREVRNAGWTRYNTDFQIGAKCLVQLDKIENVDRENNNDLLYAGETKDSNDDLKSSKSMKKEDPVYYNGHIQEMSKNEGPVVVYIEELGERKTVPYSALKPLSIRKVKHNQNWNNNLPKKNTSLDQSQKWKKHWVCSRRNKVQGPNMNMPPFERNPNEVNRKEITNETKDWNENGVKTEPLMAFDQYKTPNFNTGQNYEEVPVNPKPKENEQAASPESNHRRIPYEEDKNVSQNEINQNSSNMKNSNHYPQENDGNNMYNVKPQYNNPENISVVPTVQPINLSVAKSLDINGSDLPYSEPCTLRFFYNLGLEYFFTNQMWNYPSNDQLVSPAFFSTQNPPLMSPSGNSPVMSNGLNVINEEGEQMGDMNRSKVHNVRRKDEGMARSRNLLKNNNLPRNNERYHKSAQNVQVHGHEAQKNIRDLNKSLPHNSGERKDHLNMNKDVSRNNRNDMGPRFRKNDGRNAMYPQKEDYQNPYQNRYNNGANKNHEQPAPQGEAEMVQVQQQTFSGAAVYQVPFNQLPMYGQVAICNSEVEAYGGFYQPQANFIPVVYPPPAPANGEPPVSVDDGSGYQVFSPYMYPQPTMYGVPENWYPVAGPPTAYMPYGPVLSPNASANSQNTPAV